MPSERMNPIHIFLKVSVIYKMVQFFLSKKGSDITLYRDIISAKPGERILDLGCGPSTFRPLLGNVIYVGVDSNASHIEMARSLNSKDEFICCDILSFLKRQNTATYDKILLMGVMHHIDDEKLRSIIQLIKKKLRAGGCLIAMDPVFEHKQNWIAWFLAKLDQGKNVRFAIEYKYLVDNDFVNVDSFIRRDLLRLPYSHHFMICSNPR